MRFDATRYCNMDLAARAHLALASRRPHDYNVPPLERRRAMRIAFWLALASCVVVGACKQEPPPAPPKKLVPAAKPAVTIEPALLAAFAPLPAEMAAPGRTLSDEKIALGRMLFYAMRLSRSGDIACNSCHDLAHYGVDNKPVSSGHQGQLGSRNSPSVYNAAGHIAQFWDGRAADVEEQAKGPVLNPVEMAMPNGKAVEKVLRKIPEYVTAFKRAFPGERQPVTFNNVALAIGAFERRLLTPSRWDKFLAGDDKAESDAEKQGFKTFVEVGCTACHAGAFVGGGMFQKLGLAKPWPNDKDSGRFAVTQVETDKMVFKVPSLRNVEKTAPYFHDGSVATLEEAITLMGRHQLGRELSSEQVSSISTWLKSLTGDLPVEYITKPTLAAELDK